MPAFYAHYRFGARAIKELKPNIQKIIEDHRELFDIGTQGPDIFFYYHPLKKNEVAAYGGKLHDQKVNEFFKRCRREYAKYPDEKEAMIAYLLGFLAHYTLDMLGHPYIAKKMEVSKVSHYVIESEFDRHLLATDRNDKGATSKIVASDYNAMIIQRFYPEFSKKIVQDSIKGIKRYNEILLALDPKKAFILVNIAKRTGIKDLADHIITSKKNLACLDSDLRLDKLSDKGIKLYKDMALELIAYINGQSDLNEMFDHTFDDRDDDIKVFDIEGEKRYEV